MGGLVLNVEHSSAAEQQQPQQLDVRLSEELLCKQCVNETEGRAQSSCNSCNATETVNRILYPMRTGNTFQETWTLKADAGTSRFENHEYKLFRYGAEITIIIRAHRSIMAVLEDQCPPVLHVSLCLCISVSLCLCVSVSLCLCVSVSAAFC